MAATGQAEWPFADWATITGNENLLVLAPGPIEESLACGGLIAASCRRGRPPFVMVLGDGTSSHPGSRAYPPDRLAQLHDRETREAVRRLGLPGERLLMAGLYDGRIPEAGPAFDTVVRGVTLVMWARDCNVICAPGPQAAATSGARAAHRIAAAVAGTSGVGLLLWAREDAAGLPGAAGWRLDITPDLAAKRAAVAAHASWLGAVVTDGPASDAYARAAAALCAYEVFVRPEAV